MADRRYSYEAVSLEPAVDSQTPRMTGQPWRQYIIAAVANLSIVSIGYCMTWTSPVNLKLTDPQLVDSPLSRPITSEEEAWIGSILSLGAILGPFIGGFAASKIGRKWGLLTSSIPVFIAWILVAAATEVWFLYVARFLWGVATGIIFTCSPMYCAEIATVEARGALGSYLQVFITLGFLVVYAVGPYVSYSVVAYIGVSLTAVFTLVFYFMPESPMFYLTKNNREAAANSLSIIRGVPRSAVEEELKMMEGSMKEAMSKSAKLSDLCQKANFKALYISCGLVMFQQLCGINAVLFYMGNIFEAAGADLSTAVATIIVGGIQVLASCVTPFVVDRLGRRILLMISSCGTTIGLGLLGVYFLLDELKSPIVPSLGFLPILSLVIFIVPYCWGLGPLPWAVISELFAMEVKAVASPIATAFCWALSFLVTRYFGPIANAVGMYVAFWIFGIFCVVSFFFTLFLVPETKGRSLSEIQDILAGRETKGKA